jgi:uncharacterized protein (TIGR02996 family)
MADDENFLRAIALSRADEAPRLAYADWLEEHGDPRAAFLRVQYALARPVADAAVYRELCAREQALVRQLDPSWILRVRRFTTAPPCRDLGRLVPELLPFTRTTFRLHPHRIEERLPAEESKIGGLFLWPAAEPWPVCESCNVLLPPILQLRAADVPGVEFPPGTDLLQLFWCPDVQAHLYEFAVHLRWRAAADVTEPRDHPPNVEPTGNGRYYVPHQCAVYAERVLEYPIGDYLYTPAGSEQADRIGRLIEQLDVGPRDDLAERYASEYGPAEPQELAFDELGQCPGSKVGGRPGLKQNGRPFEHLLTLSTWEFDSASFRRWLAAEDQRLIAPPGERLTCARLFRESDVGDRLLLQEATGMHLGRTQGAHVFVCRDRVPWDVMAFIRD